MNPKVVSTAPDNCPECDAVWSHGESLKTGDDRAHEGWEDWCYCKACKTELFYPQVLELTQ